MGDAQARYPQAYFLPMSGHQVRVRVSGNFNAISRGVVEVTATHNACYDYFLIFEAING